MAVRFLHCSDIHLTQDYAEVPIFRLGWRFWMAWYELAWKKRAADYARAGEVVRQILADARGHGVDHLIVSGDLTASATEREFELAREALGDLVEDPARCSVIPGNHDCHHPLALKARRFESRFGPQLHSDLPEYARQGPYPFVRLVGSEAAVVGLHSSRLPEIPGIAYGKLGREQLEGLEALLGDPRLAGRAVLAVVHHAPLKPDGRIDKLSHRLVDTRELLGLLKGPRFAVLHGHIHHRYHHPATAHRPHLFGAGSSTQRGREGYWLIDVEGGEVKGGRALIPGQA
jgi:3',5'-cyclic AMP phosphodiesterase CpdA